MVKDGVIQLFLLRTIVPVFWRTQRPSRVFLVHTSCWDWDVSATPELFLGAAASALSTRLWISTPIVSCNIYSTVLCVDNQSKPKAVCRRLVRWQVKNLNSIVSMQQLIVKPEWKLSLQKLFFYTRKPIKRHQGVSVAQKPMAMGLNLQHHTRSRKAVMDIGSCEARTVSPELPKISLFFNI